MEARQEGLTTLYNRFHNPNDTSQDIEQLRKLHQEVDRLVAQSYGWIDLEMHHGFFDTKQGVRYSIDQRAQRKALDLLITLNAQRYQDEVQAGLHSRTVKKAKTTTKRSSSNTQGELTFFDTSNAEPVSSTHPTQAVLDWLRNRGGWHARADILSSIGIADGQWNAAIADLIASGKVERQGERRGARYRATVAVGAAQ
jgi:hypothetical protein